MDFDSDRFTPVEMPRGRKLSQELRRARNRVIALGKLQEHSNAVLKQKLARHDRLIYMLSAVVATAEILHWCVFR